MQKTLDYTKKRDAETATRVKQTAEIMGVSTRTVYRVISGDQVNPEVLNVYMQLQEGTIMLTQTIKDNLLLKAVNELVPFN